MQVPVRRSKSSKRRDCDHFETLVARTVTHLLRSGCRRLRQMGGRARLLGRRLDIWTRNREEKQTKKESSQWNLLRARLSVGGLASGRNENLLTRVLHDFIDLGRRRDADAVAFSDEDDVEGVRLRHAGELALAVTDGQRVRGIVPLQGNRRVRAFFVVVIVVLVLVEREVAVGAGINPEFDGIRLLG